MKYFSVLLLASTSLFALNVDEAFERAKQHSPLIHQAQSDVRYAQSDELGARAAFHPTLDAGFSWQDVDKTTTFSFAPTYRYSLSAKYNLFNGFADKANLDARSLESEAADLQLRATTADVHLAIVQAFNNYHKAKKAVQTHTEALASLQRAYDDTQLRFDQGMVAKNELLLIDVKRLNAKQTLVIARSDVVRAREQLSRLMGGKLGADERIDEVSPLPEITEDFASLLQQSYDNRSELQALQKVREALHLQYRAASESFYPSVDIGASYVINDQERYAGPNLVQVKEQLQTSLTLNWNLYKGFGDEALRRGFKEKVRSQDAAIAAMKLDLRYQLTDAMESYRAAKNAKEVAALAKESAAENYRITQDRFHYGEIDTLTLLEAQSDLTAANNAYNNAIYDLNTAIAAIKRICGA